MARLGIKLRLGLRFVTGHSDENKQLLSAWSHPSPALGARELCGRRDRKILSVRVWRSTIKQCLLDMTQSL